MSCSLAGRIVMETRSSWTLFGNPGVVVGGTSGVVAMVILLDNDGPVAMETDEGKMADVGMVLNGILGDTAIVSDAAVLPTTAVLDTGVAIISVLAISDGTSGDESNWMDLDETKSELLG